MIKPAKYDFTIEENRQLRRGGLFSQTFVWYDLPISTSSAEIYNDEKELIAEFTITIDGNNIVLSLTVEQLLNIPIGRYNWNFKINDIYHINGKVDIVDGGAI